MRVRYDEKNQCDEKNQYDEKNPCDETIEETVTVGIVETTVETAETTGEEEMSLNETTCEVKTIVEGTSHSLRGRDWFWHRAPNPLRTLLHKDVLSPSVEVRFSNLLVSPILFIVQLIVT